MPTYLLLDSKGFFPGSRAGVGTDMTIFLPVSLSKLQ
jgi:hypothetical protein